MMSEIFNRNAEKSLRRELRRNMPTAEVILWLRLKGRQLNGWRFRRQYSVGPFVVDFYCPEHKLGIELDGESHFEDGAQAKDRERQEYIENHGIRVVRFLNTDIYDNLDGVLADLASQLGSS